MSTNNRFDESADFTELDELPLADQVDVLKGVVRNGSAKFDEVATLRAELAEATELLRRVDTGSGIMTMQIIYADIREWLKGKTS